MRGGNAYLGKLLDAEQGVKLSLGLRQSLNVGRVDQEDDSVDLGEVVSPQSSSCAVGDRNG